LHFLRTIATIPASEGSGSSGARSTSGGRHVLDCEFHTWFGVAVFFLPTIGGGSACSADAQLPTSAAFGNKLTFESSAASYDVSADKQAFTMTVNPALEASAGKLPVGMQTFSAVIPVSGWHIDATFVVSAFVSVDEGAGATVIIAANDTSTVTRFAPGTNKGIEVVHRYRTQAASEIRLAVFLLADRDQAHPNASAGIHADNIDGEFGPPKKRGKKQ
jgi:hypothetical protein